MGETKAKVYRLGLVMVSVLAGVAAAAEAPPSRALGNLIHQGSAFASRFDAWSEVYGRVNGDRRVTIAVGPSRALSTEPSAGHGVVQLDLIGGRVEVVLEGLSQPVDVWLLDNQPGPGRSIRPEAGDRLLQLARLEGGSGKVVHDFGADFLRGVEPDRILVVPAGKRPAESLLLTGSRPLFERLYTQARLARESGVAPILEPLPEAATGPSTLLMKLGEVSPLVFRGGDIFFRETFAGNGRSCGTCHPAENNQVLDPEFIDTLPPTDPLFIAEQSAGTPLENLEKPPLLREFGLILENIDNFSDPGERFVMRGVPHTLSLATSIQLPLDEYGQIPDGGTFDFLERTGWSGDGAPQPGTLRDFVIGAIFQHYPAVNFENRQFIENGGVDFRMPTEGELDAVEAFMLNVGRLKDIDLEQVKLTDFLSEEGRLLFMDSACNTCHHNAGANFRAVLPDGTVLEDGNRIFNTAVERVQNPAQGFQGITFPADGGFGGQTVKAFNFDSDGDGVLDSFGNGEFNVPPLIEAADTAPFFHNNFLTGVNANIFSAIVFYIDAPFNSSPASDFLDEIGQGPIVLNAFDITEMASFLRVLNTGFNLDLARQRSEVAQRLNTASMTSASLQPLATVNKLLELANAELDDVADVLLGGPNPDARTYALEAIDFNQHAIASTDPLERRDLIREALDRIAKAKMDLGTGLEFELGEGNLLF